MSLVIATTSFAGAGSDGREYLVAAGQTYTTDHPVYAGRESLFQPAEDRAQGARVLPQDMTRVRTDAVETADATPGTRRIRTAPPK